MLFLFTKKLKGKLSATNLVIRAEFFKIIVDIVIKGFIGSGIGEMGILGKVVNYFGVIESNGKGILYIYFLI